MHTQVPDENDENDENGNDSNNNSNKSSCNLLLTCMQELAMALKSCYSVNPPMYHSPFFRQDFFTVS